MSLAQMTLENILYFIVKFIISFINLLLLPIDTLIKTFIPDLSNILSSVGNYLSVISSGIGWAISLSGLSSATISLIITYYIFKLTTPLVFYFIKMAVQWYDKLKL